MLLLLPPSEGKTPPATGAPVDLAALSAPALTGARELVLGAVEQVSARPDAPAILGVGAKVADEVGHNLVLRTAPAAPAAAVYTGVLYAAAGLRALRGSSARRARESVRIFSGLWGVLTPADAVPAYRLSMGVDLPGAGKLAAFWRSRLGDALDEQATGNVVVDCRSATYATAWRPPAGAEHVVVQVVREQDGRRQVVSHNAKHARGVLTHHLLTRGGRAPRTAEDLAGAAEELTRTAGQEAGAVHAVELGPAVRGPRTLTLVERS
ncbi:peroxide stress protein YaaA [Georgenia yuyongxinii]|uniref:Peroxide stress protein YaaA n=1 Tax=Georgenia yuyongxinii TaxID=2589797 RepID=A0A5B8C604_9MICO|nr:peroxide stress protein YaaA [Georgenia yuyongxinii]QDC24821.1 peroxide stress protein YaaA [Georgenia yuyongxinii]